MDGMEGEKDVVGSVDVVTAGLRPPGTVDDLKDEVDEPVGGTITGFPVSNLTNWTMSHMNDSSGIVLRVVNWLPTIQNLPWQP